MRFDDFLKLVKDVNECFDVYLCFIEGNLGLEYPPFGGRCDLQHSVQSFIPKRNIEKAGFERIIVYKNFFSDDVVGVYLGNITPDLLIEIKSSGSFFGKKCRIVSEANEDCNIFIEFI